MSVAIFHRLDCLHDAAELAPYWRADWDWWVEKLARWCARS